MNASFVDLLGVEFGALSMHYEVTTPDSLQILLFKMCLCLQVHVWGETRMSVPAEVTGQPWVVPSTSFGKGSLIGLELTNYASLAQ